MHDPKQDDSTQAEVDSFCTTNYTLYLQDFNQYLRRYFLLNKAMPFAAGLLLITAILLSHKMGDYTIAFTRIPSFLLLLSYRRLSYTFQYPIFKPTNYCLLIQISIVIETIFIFSKAVNADKLDVLAESSPALTLLLVWLLCYHPIDRTRIIRALSISFFVVACLTVMAPSFALIHLGSMIAGSGMGFFISSLISRQFRYKFYFSHQEKDLRRHAYRQLGKLVYPHQRTMIEKGKILEETMPANRGEACVIAFDVIESTKIQDQKMKDLLQSVLLRCHNLMMENYSEIKMEANGYRIKELGDGFITFLQRIPRPSGRGGIWRQLSPRSEIIRLKTYTNSHPLFE